MTWTPCGHDLLLLPLRHPLCRGVLFGQSFIQGSPTVGPLQTERLGHLNISSGCSEDIQTWLVAIEHFGAEAVECIAERGNCSQATKEKLGKDFFALKRGSLYVCENIDLFRTGCLWPTASRLSRFDFHQSRIGGRV